MAGLMGLASCKSPGHELEVKFGPKGLEKLVFRGDTLSDVERWPEDAFHIWHMECFDAQGKVLTSGQYGWGENNEGRVWDAESKAWVYRFTWGTLKTRFVQDGDTLNVTVEVANKADSGVVVDGASVYPVVLHFPNGLEALPGGNFALTDGKDTPGITVARWSGAQVAAISGDAFHPVWSGFEAAANSDGIAAVTSGTLPDALRAKPVAHAGLNVQPGQTVTVPFSLRFARGKVALPELARDAYENFARRWPATLHWPDRRMIGSVYLASAGSGSKTHAAGYPGNPRRYFNQSTLHVLDPAGLLEFQGRLLEQADAIVANLGMLRAQGAITWDIEGEEFPHDTSYVCAPDQLAAIAPEMESVVAVPHSRFAGMKLADAYFKRIRDAGYRVGVCVRPQRFTLGEDGTAQQVTLPDEEALGELIRKMRYAHDRWGATLFYVDSTVRADGVRLPTEVIEAAAAAMPDSLLIPEEVATRAYRATAPFLSFLFHGDLGTSPEVRAIYPRAFSANLVNDADPDALKDAHGELVNAVRNGDVLMVHAQEWQANNPDAVAIYAEAHKR